jgi:hypothetical protein
MSDYPGGIDPLSGDPQGGPNPGSQGGYNPPGTHGQPPGGYGQPAGPPGHGGNHGGAGSSRVVFDAQTIVPGGLIAIVGGLLYFVFSFFPWYAIHVWFCDPSLGVPCQVNLNAWDRGSATCSVIIFLFVALAFVAKALKLVRPTFPLEVIALAAILLGDVLFLTAFFTTPDGLSRGWGLWIDLVVLLAINLGGVIQFIRVGGAGSIGRGLSTMQQRASGPSGSPPPGPYPPQPNPPQGGYPPHPPQQPGHGGPPNEGMP